MAVAPLQAHWHPGILEVFYIVSGQYRFQTADGSHLLRGGDVCLLFPGEEHSSGGAPQERASHCWLGVLVEGAGPFLGCEGADGETFRAALRALGKRVFRGEPSFQQAIAAALRWYASDDPLRRVRTIQVLTGLLLDILGWERRVVPAPPSAAVAAAMAYLRDRLPRHIPLSELAAVAGLSESRFKERFKREIGMPPGEFMMRERIQRAESLLRTPRRTITKVALALGFSSSQSFATAFRKYTNLTPRQYRRLRPGDSPAVR
jgi:AraC-like DNA-binding protein